MISLDKKYRTKDGKEVRIYAVDGAGNRPVHGAVLYVYNNKGWEAATWASCDADLIEVVMIPEYWVVFESDGNSAYVTNENPTGTQRIDMITIHHPAQEKPHE